MSSLREVVIGIVGYNFYQRLAGKHGQINVLFYGALFLTIAVALFAWGLHALVNSGADESWGKLSQVLSYMRQIIISKIMTTTM